MGKPVHLPEGVHFLQEKPSETRTGSAAIDQEKSWYSDPTVEQMMRIVEASGTLDFWDDEAEDIYKATDDESS